MGSACILKMELTGFLTDCTWDERQRGLGEDSKPMIPNLLLKWKCLKIDSVPRGLNHPVHSFRIRNLEWEPCSCGILEPSEGGERCVALWDRALGVKIT